MRDPVNTGSLVYEYASFKEIAGGGCGQYAYFGTYSENGSPCPLSGHSHAGNTHCHIYIPGPLPGPCDTAAVEVDPVTLCTLRDTVDTY
jgi:hypothetical protein